MRTKHYYFLALLMLACNAEAQYSSVQIPAALKETADLVVRLEEKEVRIKSKGNAIVRHHYVYTILNAAGDKYANLTEHYSKLVKVNDVTGTLYDAQGTKIKALKKGEIKDYSNTEESQLADDNRVKYHNFNHNFYPYTVEYESIVEEEGVFQLPRWIPVFSENIAVEKSMLTVITPSDYVLRYKTFNYTGSPLLTETKNSKEYNWQLANYSAGKREVYSPWWHEITPSVFLAPSAFTMQRYEGTMNNWQEFGTFIYKLNAGRDQLPDVVKLKVRQLTYGINDNQKKIEILYNYLQQNTRYISIQLGIGGWQTLDANFVASNGYGDCKALTNYMYALLKEVGVKSCQALIYAGAGEETLMDDFASNQFNHVVLCVPQEKDSIWLECTSQTTQPGYMGSFTGNRKALLIDEKNSTLVQTPFYKATDNLQTRRIVASLDEHGMLSANVESTYAGIQQDRLESLLNGYAKDQLTEHMRNKFQLSSYDIKDFSHQKSKTKLPVITEKVTLAVKDFASVTGKRLFINPNVLSVSTFKIKNGGARKYDFDVSSAFTDLDSVVILIPAGYKAESLPKDVDLRMAHAAYKSSINIIPGKIIYTRLYTQNAAKIPAVKATELTNFFDNIYRADHARIVFVKEGL
ncbi:MAG: DUF3857 domain-containing protein [Chitinophagaceae bacterium]|nr:MAG: DUF3857 domain-containing protein [Chitinophagaceae bacterium]